ncbi:heterokaryon incompatibility protein-domain-containing protein [Apiosordaria backusii]|uniref:Heterokaryon incompatibility protein-domain-containing protein n=1 Tax=Apiosordaria backusii TaxID=314023 RepID=A0AA40BT48_9PEZI|nr:heterokaryon incompatibility protein-domain-containing protein [Apiosordaria backusii]
MSADRMYERFHDLTELRLGCYCEWQTNQTLEPARFGQIPEDGGPADVFPEAEVQAWTSDKRETRRKNSHKTLYQPILDPYEIRVLEIKPGSNDEPIQCCLHRCSLEFKERPRQVVRNSETSPLKSRLMAVPQSKFGLLMHDLAKPIWYTSLSYTWGPPVFDMAIKVDGHEKLVTSRYQICIDQTNKNEKAQQIPLVSTIYTRAINTIVWLGDGDSNMAAAFDFLNGVPDLIQHTSAIRCPEDFERLSLPHPDSATWKGVWDLVRRPWFQRLWIYQEVILSQDITIACGGPHKARTRMNWDIFAGACLALQESGITQSLCYDPQDKIYGLLGMIEIKNSWIKISYHDSYTYPSLYHDVVVGLLQRNTSPLNGVLNSIDHEPLGGCPSWVPDWSKPRETVALGYESSTTNVYNVELHIEGRVFDTIAVLSDVLADPNIVQPLSANKDWIHCIDFVARHFQTAYPSSHGSVFTAFWHTTVVGKDSSGMHPCLDSFAEIFSLLLDETTGRSPSLPGQTYSPRQLRPRGKGKLTLASLESRQPKKTFEEIRVAMREPLKGRRLVKTERGYIGLVSRYARVGDGIGIVKGWLLDALCSEDCWRRESVKGCGRGFC